MYYSRKFFIIFYNVNYEYKTNAAVFIIRSELNLIKFSSTGSNNSNMQNFDLVKFKLTWFNALLLYNTNTTKKLF